MGENISVVRMMNGVFYARLDAKQAKAANLKVGDNVILKWEKSLIEPTAHEKQIRTQRQKHAEEMRRKL